MSRIRLKHEKNAYYLRRRKYHGVCADSGQPQSWWWQNGKWKCQETGLDTTKDCCSHAPIFSIRKFKQMLVTAPKGVVFVLCSRYVDADCRGVGRGNNLMITK